MSVASVSATRVLVLGGSGMLGQVVVRQLIDDGFAVTAATRGVIYAPAEGAAWLAGDDLRDPAATEQLFAKAAPDVVVNCAGLVKQRLEAADPVATIAMNASLPHRLAALCSAAGARLIHIGTDCVFSGAPQGQRGPAGYREADPADPGDLYGRSKLLGEAAGPGSLTLRMSLIGREPHGLRLGLVEWFLAAKPPVQGYSQALFTGLTCPVAARLISLVIREHPDLDGLWHAAADPISKLDLLYALRDRARPNLLIDAAPGPPIDRRLDGTALFQRIGWRAPDWPTMLDELLGPVAADAVSS